MTMLASALEYASRGWRVTPYHSINDNNSCTCGKNDCARPGKHPKHNRYIEQATTEPDRIHMWFGLSEPANPAIVVGKRSGIVILDIESEEGHGADGLETLKNNHPPLFATRAERTPTDGGHLYFQHPGNELLENLSSRELGPGLELRAESVAVVAAPSVTPDGSYAVTKDLDLAPLPNWLLEKSREKRTEKEKVRNAPPFEPSPKLSDEEIWEKALNATNAPKLRQLCAGDWQTLCESWSHADAGLLGILAFYTQDPEQLERLWQSTDLWRGKKSGKSAVYADCTITHALSKTTETYKAPDDSATFLTGTSSSNGYIKNETAEEILEISHDITTSWPALPDDNAYYGLASRVCDLIEPYCEADSIAILSQFLAAFGVACGKEPRLEFSAERHTAAVYMALVGPSARGRKGSAWNPIQILFDQADPTYQYRMFDGIGSGEKLVEMVHDAIFDSQGNVKEQAVQDKRLLLQTSELSDLLTVAGREGSTMSQKLRLAFDGKVLQTHSRRGGDITSHGYHIGMIGQITPDELRSKLTPEQIKNGLGNRVAFFMSKRAKRLPDPPIFEGQEVQDIIEDLKSKLAIARGIGRVRRTKEAQRLWEKWYLELPDDNPGIVGILTERAETYVNKFSLIYALTDGSDMIEECHLKAAIALWDYSTRCIQYIFGDDTGDDIADRIVKELHFGPLTRTQITSDVFNRNLPPKTLEYSLKTLLRNGKIVSQRVKGQGPGRPVERFSLTNSFVARTPDEQNEENEGTPRGPSGNEQNEENEGTK